MEIGAHHGARREHLAAHHPRQGSCPQPFTREVVAVKGSREPYHARMVPYYNSTDHHAFTPAHIGVPATSLTNWPDEFIHSTGDDIDQIDATQLERNAVVVSGVALYFANVGDADLPVLASYSAARGTSRLAADGATASCTSRGGRRVGRLPRGAQPHHRTRRNKERGALASIARLAGGKPSAAVQAIVDEATATVGRAEASHLNRLDLAFAAATGTAKPAARKLSADEE